MVSGLLRRLTGAARPAAARVLFVCHNNTCRSPMARIVATALLRGDGPAIAFEAAGTHAVGNERVDGRAASALARRGYAADRVRSRRVAADELDAFDLVVAMDAENLEALRAQRPDLAGRLRLLLDFTDGPPGRDVPDPYWGGPAGFDHVLGLCEEGCRGVIAALRKKVSGRP